MDEGLDVVPTILDPAGIEHPADSGAGRVLEQPSGHSLMPLLEGNAKRVHDPDQVFAFELFGRRAIRQGDWKAIYLPYSEKRTEDLPELVQTDRWQLFNLAEDPAETRDLAAQHPQRLRLLLERWSDYVETGNVILSPDATPY